jgi:sigma-B regulation protein RsbU (phosphoserine phosphatase)
MDGVRYRENEITLNKGDRLFLYTDGVPEATNVDNKLYGEDRLLSFMNKNLEVEPTSLLPKLKNDIDKFVGKAPQFDDITMLIFDYKIKKESYLMTKTFPAKTESLNDVLSFIEQALEQYECPMKLQVAICVAIEEVFVNVAHYAYSGGDGDVTFNISFNNDNRNVTFQMIDGGVHFDPLKKDDPDITLSAEERQIGGLGIFITKKTMDQVIYAYEDSKNILTMIKKI